MQLRWTEEALSSFNDVADYLSQRFQQREVVKFFDRTDEIIANILAFPYLFKPYTGDPKIQHGILHKNVTLFSRVFEQEEVI
jgi:plasmid stabilization system protein ParE